MIYVNKELYLLTSLNIYKTWNIFYMMRSFNILETSIFFSETN